MSSRAKFRIAQRGAVYLLALIGVAAAAAVRYQMGPILGGTIPVVVFTVPVMLAALYGGFGPGMLATLASAAVSVYLFIEPLYSFRLETPSSIVVLLVFILVGTTLSFFGQRMRTLRARLSEQAHRLACANRELEEGDRRKDEFLAMLAHELRNPLAGISTAAELLKFARDQQRIAQTGEIIGRQVRHMTKLVDDLLDVSRVTRGLVLIEKKPLDLKEAVRGAVEQVSASLEAKRQLLLLRLPDDDVCVCGDRIRLTQVIGNLLANAARYSRDGTAITLTVRIARTTVELDVEDEGQGIDAALLPHVFDLFVQAERSPDRSQGGLGIGLALVRRIVELHEGAVKAQSEGRERGSRFTITLPRLLRRSRSRPPTVGRQARSRPSAGLNILVVDDNADAADTVSLLLQSSGHTVHTEYSAGAALDRAHAEELDAAILDIGLPDKDGRSLCRDLRSIPHLKDTVFIALSGYGQEHDRRLSKEAGFHRHLVKPVDMEELMDALSLKTHAGR